MAAEERWYFTKQQLADTSNRKCGIDPDRELSYRQQAANFIQDMGQRLQVNQLCINTAIVYMHRFYMFHTFTKFHRNAISTCALFLAAKVEEQPRKLEHVIKVAHLCLHRDAPPLDTKSEAYLEQAQELVINENIMLQTLGFDVAIDHPHTHVVKCCQLVRGGSTSLHQHHASKDLAQTSYFMATNSLHLTTMCLQYKPTVVACVCIHLACKWGNWEIPKSSEGKKWFFYVDKTVTEELLEELTSEFLAILDRCPSRLKRKMMSANSAGEIPELNTSDAQTRTASGVSLSLNSLSSVKGEKSSDKHHDRERDRPSSNKNASSQKSTSSAAATSVDKNGPSVTAGGDRRERMKKEHINSSAGNFQNSAASTSVLSGGGDSNQQPALTSPGKLVKIPNSMDSALLSVPVDASHSAIKKQRSDGTPRTMTPKEYHEYRERSKREKEKMKIAALPEQNRNLAAVKQGSSSSIRQLNVMDEFSNIMGDDAAPSLHHGSTKPISTNVKRTPECDIGKGSNMMKSVSNLPPESGTLSSMTGFSMGPILTPSPPTTKDGDPFNMDEEMAVFTSPSDLLVPVVPPEIEQPRSAVNESVKVSISKGDSHKKQRKDEQKVNLQTSPSAFSNFNNELAKSQFNSSLVTSESKRREKDYNDSVDGKTCSVDAERKHHSVKSSAEKLIKHHRVKKPPPELAKNDLHPGNDGFLPHQDSTGFAPELRLSTNKLPELNNDMLRVPSDSYSQASADAFQQSTSNVINSSNTLSFNESKVNFQEKRHSNHQKNNSQVVTQSQQQIPDNTNNLNERPTVEAEVTLQPFVSQEFKSGESESKYSKRSSQSSASSKHEKKEKRKKHEKKEKSREHVKEKSEEKSIPKFKLTIPKEALSGSSNAGASKTETNINPDILNHKPKDESLVVKIKLNASSSSGKSSKNGNLPEVVQNTQTETLAIKERSGLKLKITKNPSSKESYSIGNDEAKSKDKGKHPKESRKRSRSSSSPKSKETLNEPELAAAVPPAKTLKTTSSKSPKKVSINTNNNNQAAPMVVLSNSSAVAPSNAEPSFKVDAARQGKNEIHQQSVQPQSQLPVTQQTVINNNVDYNRRHGAHEREHRRGGKRGRGGGNVRMGVPMPPGPPMPPMPHPQQQAMMYNMPMGMYDRASGAGGDAYSQFYNFGQNNFFNHQMGYQDENPMFFNQCAPPLMRPHPPPHPMAFQPAVHQQSRRSGHHYLRPPILPPRPGSGPPLPSVPPPANPPLPPDM